MTLLDRGVGLAVAAATPLLPAWWGVHHLNPRLRDDVSARFGVAPVVAEPGSVWIVAASMGEVGAAAALLPHLRGPVVLTADTDTGVGAARRAVARHPRAVAQARPVDHPWTIAPLWAEARPRALVLVEGAWWPALVGRARRAGVPVLAVQARAGGTASRWPRTWRSMISSWTAAVARDDEAAARLAAAGVRVVGIADLKRDHQPAGAPLAGVAGAIVGMSTRAGDEEALLDAWQALGRPARLVLAPRHPARFDAVWAQIAHRDVRAVRRTELADDTVPDPVEVVLLDSLGECAAVVSGAAAAFVGGTRDRTIGGHSPAEAVRCGVPVVAGPHVGSHAAAFAGAFVGDDLVAGLRAALDRGRHTPEPSDAGLRTVAALEPWLNGPPARACAPRPWLRPLTGPISLASRARGAGYDWGVLGVQRVSVPVVAVGSANARGAGKTAAAAWAARHLAAAGHRVGIAVRGHGRARLGGSRRGVWTSRDGLDAALLGDEGVRLAMAGFDVAASPDRIGAARALVALGCTAIVLDDGLQHRRLHRDLDLVVVDGAHPTARGPLPAGEAREVPVPTRASAVLAIGTVPPDTVPVGVPVTPLTPRIGPWVPGAPPGRVAIIVGVGAPGRALAALREDLVPFDVAVVADHAPVADRVRGWLERGLSVATTAKDAARLPPDLRERVHHRELVLDGAWPDGVPLPYDGSEPAVGGASGPE